MKADIIVDLQYGDSGKGKVAYALCKENPYDYCLRFNGGNNAGHTIWEGDKKFITHSIPSGILHGIPSIIGAECVLDINHLENEIKELEALGVNVRDNLFVDYRVALITEQHLKEDGKDTEVGTTRRGIGPAYRDKYARIGKRVKDLKSPNFNVVDSYELLFKKRAEELRVLCEGAQGFGLDITWGDYPYCTSSHTNVGGAVSCGIPPRSIRNIYGVGKVYRTYVGSKVFERDDPVMEQIRTVGGEFGSTTGRPRQVDYIDLEELIIAARINDVDTLILNKTDVLRKVGVWNVVKNDKVYHWHNEDSFKEHVSEILHSELPALKKLVFSDSPAKI